MMLTGKNQIRYFQLAAAKGAIKLEAIGMRHSSGRSIRKMYAIELGLKPRAPAAEVISAIQTEMDNILNELSVVKGDENV
jgi:hypothetical protein